MTTIPVPARRPRSSARSAVLVLAVSLVAATPFLFSPTAPAAGPTPPSPFSGLPAGYTADVYGMAYSFLGGVGFVGWSPTMQNHPGTGGDPVADQCTVGHSGLIRFNSSSTTPAPDGVTVIHPQIRPYLRSDTGCGIINSSDRHLYAAVDNGVAQLDGTDGHFQRLFGGRTNTLGIDIDPVTRGVAFLDRSCDVGSTGCIVREVDPTSGKITTFARLTAQQAAFVDGMAFEPRGQYLLLNTRTPTNEVTVLDRTGRVTQQIALAHEPDGIVFHTNPDFALITTTDGLLMKLAFPLGPAPDYTSAPTVAVFAGGGFRGDLASAGPDGCLYLSQDKTRLAAPANATTGTVVASDSSVVRICGPGSFVAEFISNASPNVSTQASVSVPAGGKITDTATITGGNNPKGGITFTAYGPGDATCAAPPVFTSAPVPVNGNGAYTAGPFTTIDAGSYRWVASYSGDPFNNPAGGACNDANESVIVTPQILTGRSYGLSAKITALTLSLTVPPTPDTGSISTTTPSATTTPCFADLTGPITAHTLCAGVTTGLRPSRSSATAGATDVSVLSIPLVPTITLRNVQSQSDSNCAGSTGKTTVGFVQIGPIVVQATSATPGANTGINVLGVKVILNEQIPVPGGLTVNGAHITVPGILDLVVASATSDIHNCP